MHTTFATMYSASSALSSLNFSAMSTKEILNTNRDKPDMRFVYQYSYRNKQLSELLP